MRKAMLFGALFAGLLMACDFVAALPGVRDSAAPAKTSAAAAGPESPPAAILRAPTATELLRSCPLESVALADLHKLLDQGEFAKVDEALDTLLEGYRKAPACEVHLWEAVGLACSLDLAQLDRWVVARPESWGALSGRACRWIDTGYQSRGTALAKNVTDAQWAAMRDAFAHAESDLMRALEIEPDGYVAYGYAIYMVKAFGATGQIQKWLDALVARDPYNYEVRRRAMQSLSPQWGGSIEQMREVATDAQAFADGNPMLRQLPGFAEAEAAVIDWRASRFKEAARGYRRALDHGAVAEWYAGLADCLTRLGFWAKLAETSDEWIADLGDGASPREWRGRARAELGDLAGALVDLDQAHTLSPRNATILGLRGVARWRSGLLREAAEDFRLVIEIEPNDPWAIAQLRTLEGTNAKSAPVAATVSEATSLSQPGGERTLPALSRLDRKAPNP